MKDTIRELSSCERQRLDDYISSWCESYSQLMASCIDLSAFILTNPECRSIQIDDFSICNPYPMVLGSHSEFLRSELRALSEENTDVVIINFMMNDNDYTESKNVYRKIENDSNVYCVSTLLSIDSVDEVTIFRENSPTIFAVLDGRRDEGCNLRRVIDGNINRVYINVMDDETFVILMRQPREHL